MIPSMYDGTVLQLELLVKQLQSYPDTPRSLPPPPSLLFGTGPFSIVPIMSSLPPSSLSSIIVIILVLTTVFSVILIHGLVLLTFSNSYPTTMQQENLCNGTWTVGQYCPRSQCCLDRSKLQGCWSGWKASKRCVCCLEHWDIPWNRHNSKHVQFKWGLLVTWSWRMPKSEGSLLDKGWASISSVVASALANSVFAPTEYNNFCDIMEQVC